MKRYAGLGQLCALANLMLVVSLLPPSVGARPEREVQGFDNECPFRFDSDMPAGIFCVYVGELASADGRICSRNAAVIWSSYHPQETLKPEEPAVVVGFADAPEVVLIAEVGDIGDRAQVVGYSTGREDSTTGGELMLDGKRERETLRIALEADVSLGECSLATFEGAFVGLISFGGEQASVSRVPIRSDRHHNLITTLHGA